MTSNCVSAVGLWHHLSDCLSNACSSCISVGVLNLRGAWHAGNYYLVHLPELLRAVQGGTPPAYREDESFDLHRLWFYKSEVQAYLGRVETGKLTPVVGVGTTGKWRYFSRRNIESMLSEWITIAEAASLLGAHRSTIEGWCKTGKLVPVGRGIKGRLWLDRTAISEMVE